jgi:telomeric repeat-binding factor 2-interacting protein 1
MEGDDGGGNSSGSLLFDGKQFWLSHNIPQRNRFKELIEVCFCVLVLFYS